MPTPSTRGPAINEPARQFDALLRPHISLLYSTAYRLLGDRADAEDLVQEVLIKLFPRTADLQELRDLRQWLLRVLYRQFVDFTRRRARRPRTVPDEGHFEGAQDPAAGPEEQAMERDATARIDAALARLSLEHRTLVALHLLGGHTLDELTTVLDVPLGTLKSRLHRAKAALRGHLGLAPDEGNPFQQSSVLLRRSP